MKNFIQKLIKEAGEMALEFFKKEERLFSIRGSSKEIVTKYDKILDKFIIEEIKKKYPSHSLLTEESGFLKGKTDYLWIIDSLDGSSNFANKNPLFSICLALMKKKDLLYSSIFAPVINEFYFAQKGNGAFLNGKKIKVSTVSDISRSYVFYCDGREKNRKKVARLVFQIYPEVKDLRKIGSAGIETGWIASGRGEIFFATKIDPWDIAAGTLLVKEAGGKITDFTGKPWQPQSGDFVFSNGKVHQAFLRRISF